MNTNRPVKDVRYVQERVHTFIETYRNDRQSYVAELATAVGGLILGRDLEALSREGFVIGGRYLAEEITERAFMALEDEPNDAVACRLADFNAFKLCRNVFLGWPLTGTSEALLRPPTGPPCPPAGSTFNW